MITPITATFPALNFPKESDYPTQNDWAAFSTAAELNYGILSGEWSLKSELYKNQMNTLALQIQDIGENAINAITFDNISQLKLNSNMGRVDLLGYYTKGDGGGGTFYWDSTSIESDNGGTIIQATGIATGRWKRPTESTIKPRQYGLKCDGITNDTTAFNNMMNSFTSLKVLELTPSDIIKLDTIEWKYSKCNIMGNGATFDFSSSTATYAVTFEQDVNNIYRAFCNNVKFKGNSTTHAFKLEGSITGHLANINFDGITIYQFDRQLEIGRSVSNIHFTNSLLFCDGTQYRQSTAIYLTTNATNNTGEQISFKGCQLGSHKYVVDNNASLTGAINFNQCSLVYFNSCIKLTQSGRVSLNQCSIESNVHTEEWFIVGTKGEIKIEQTEFIFSSSSLTNYIFKSATANLFGGIVIRDCTYNINPATTVTIDCFSNKTVYGKVEASNFNILEGMSLIPMGLNNGSQLIPFLPNNTLFKNLLLPYSDDASTLATDATVLFNGLSTTSLSTSGGQIKRLLRIDKGKATNPFLGYLYFYSSTTTAIQLTITFYNGDNIALGSVLSYSAAPTANTWIKVNLGWYPMPPTNWAYATLNIYGVSATRKLNLGEIVING